MALGIYHRLTFKSIGYNTIAKLVTYVFSLASSIVLGRCLLASDYGIVSFAFIFYSFVEKFSDFGIGSAIIQKKELDDATLYTAFTLKFAIGCAVALAMLLMSVLVPFFFDRPEAAAILRVLSVCFLFYIFHFLPNALLTREMDFRKISLVETAAYLTNSVIAIALALNGFGYWSMIGAYLATSFVSAAMMLLLRPVRLRFRFDVAIARELLGFGGYLFLSGFLAFLIFNLDNFLIGSVSGATVLGYYAIAFNWGAMICLILYSVVLRVILPLMTKLQENEIRSSFLKTVEYTGYLIVLANIGLFVVSREFLVSVLGHGSDKWLPALTALRILCLYGIVRGLLEPIGQVIIAVGRPVIIFQATLLAFLIEATALYPVLKFFGIEGVACLVTFAYLSQYVVYYHFLKNTLQIGVRDLLRAVRPSAVAAAPVLVFYAATAGFGTATLAAFFGKAAAVVVIYSVGLGMATDWELFALIKTWRARKEMVRETS